MSDQANPIPPIVDPMGRSWSQPDHRRFLFDATHVLMTAADFAKLPEYSTTNPSGTYAGKMWRRQDLVRFGDAVRPRRKGVTLWWLCWYFDVPEPGRIGIGNREVLLV